MTVLSLAEADHFATYFYENGSPGLAPQALLAICRQTDVVGLHISYFFSRIAAEHPDVLREMESLLTEPELGPSVRPTVLKVLELAGDEQTAALLGRLAGDEAFQRESDRIAAILAGGIPAPLDVSSKPIESPLDLDLQWADFHLTGAAAPVRRIIEVLERPDRVRDQLAPILGRLTRKRFGRWLMRRTFLRPLEAMGVVLDPDERGIASAQDLDCLLSMSGFDISHERWVRFVRLAYRVGLHDVKAATPEVMLKAGARWALASRAREHDRVLEVCAGEAAVRTGRARLVLLEIVSRTRAGKRDMGGAIEALHESLDPDPSRRRTALAELDAVLALETGAADATASGGVAPAGAVAECANATEAHDSYCAKLVVGPVPDATTQRDSPPSWRVEVSGKDRCRVRQVIASEVDEWVAIGERHFRGPLFTPVDPRDASTLQERRVTRLLLVDTYVGILRDLEPMTAVICDVGSRRLYAVTYGADAVRRVLRSLSGSRSRRASAANGVLPAGAGLPSSSGRSRPEDGPLLLLIDAESKLLVRAELSFASGDGAGAHDDLRVRHGFAAYGEVPAVVPPPFQLAQAGILQSARA